MGGNRKFFIDIVEFQDKVLEYIGSEYFNKMFNSTIFKDVPDYKRAVVHGMVMASMITSQCKLYHEEQENL